MWSKLASAISKILKSAGFYKHVDPSPWHTRVLKAFESATTMAKVLDAMVDLEGLICAYVTLELSRYQLTAPIAGQRSRLPEIYRLAQVLFDCYRVLSVHARPIASAIGGEMEAAADGITHQQLNGKNEKKALDFVTQVEDFVVLSLVLATRAEVGSGLVTQLAAAHARLAVRVVYKEEASSLLAYAGGGQAFCKVGNISLGPNANLRGRVAPITPNTGAPSEMGAPVWFDSEERSAGMLQADSFKHQGVETALAKILLGSISFTVDRTPFFTPARIEILHELIHVLHNARGTNREAIRGLTREESDAWHNSEEYWTIAGGSPSENAFNATIGAPDRYGHGGLTLSGLHPESEMAQYSLKRHAGF